MATEYFFRYVEGRVACDDEGEAEEDEKWYCFDLFFLVLLLIITLAIIVPFQ